MLTDIQIAQNAKMLHIKEVAEKMGINEDELTFYGKHKAKLSQELFDRVKDKKNAPLVLVTAINPTPAGEGKTTTTVGLGDALSRLGKKAMIALREPSLGPVMGIKGGAAGGGYAQVVPMEDINLHFTGDMHAITSAHNLLAALIDNHIHQGNSLKIDTRRILFKRVLDMNDRALRNIVVGLGGKINGVPREDGFMITVASEIMAILCLASDREDLKERLSKIVVAFDVDNNPVTAKDLKAEGAMTLLLKDAILPNLVQTLEHTPCLVHGGPFANIAHGCNSLMATKIALKLSDIVVTEAGFGADLGAEKFLDIKCRYGNLNPNAVVIVATVRALKYAGGVSKDNLKEENIEAVKKGIKNLEKHIENMQKFGLPVVVALNKFDQDTEEEIKVVRKCALSSNARFAVSDCFAQGGEGGMDLAKEVLLAIEEKSNYKPIYDLSLSIEEKIRKIAQEVYGAKDINLSPQAKNDILDYERLGYGNLPICMAKTQYSLSDNPKLLGRPEGFILNVSKVSLSAGAGFIVCLTGDILTMPGLPKIPSAEKIDIDNKGNITGLF